MENLINYKEAIGTQATRKRERRFNEYDVIVFCHLRWDFVYQRPQHVISRLSEERKVLFVEEPVGLPREGEERVELIEIGPRLHVLKPRVAVIEEISGILADWLPQKSVPLAW